MTSSFQFQKVMAALIRFPDKSLAQLLPVTERDLLTPLQVEALEQMSTNPLVRKFGEKMRYVRFRDTTETLRLTRRYLGYDVLQAIYCELFDPFKTSTDYTQAGLEFGKFLLSSDRCGGYRQRWPAFITDLIRYEVQKEETINDVIFLDDPLLPTTSLLAHRAFSIAFFEFDCASIDRQLTDNPSVLPEPVRRKNTLLFMRSLQAPYHKAFEIDETIQTFLEIQRENPGSWDGNLPDAFEAMVSVGLCRRSPLCV